MTPTKAMPARHCESMAAHAGHAWTLLEDQTVWCPGTNVAESGCSNPHPHEQHHWFVGPYGEDPFTYCPGREPAPVALPDGECGDPEPHSPHDWAMSTGDIHCVGVVDKEVQELPCDGEPPHDEHNWVGGEGGQLYYCPGEARIAGRLGPDWVVKKSTEGEPADMAYIRDYLVAEWWDHYHSKAMDYNDGPAEHHRELGIKGQFSDLHRKHGKLKKALWDGGRLASEQPREICLDQISHLFLILAMMDEEGRRG
jgi:hypothetical protein